ncbi:MAG TPA: hypothetical protein VGM90_07525 [Kofleriaceae bacterium]|jgi:hypothetical protein
MLHHAPSPISPSATPQNDFVTLTDEELARVDGGFIQMLGALLNIAGPLISQLANKGSRGHGSSSGGSSNGGSSNGDSTGRDQGQGTDQSQSGDQGQSQRSSGGGFNLGSILGMFGGGGS